VCDLLSDLQRATARYATRFDPSTVSCADAEVLVRNASAIEASAKTIKALAALRAAEARTWSKNGRRSVEEHVSRETGTSISDARTLLETGRRLADQAELSKAARTGRVSFEQASLISNAAEVDPSAEPRLLEQAHTTSLGELKDLCAEVKAKAAPDPEARRAKIHARRSLRTWNDVEGVWHLHASGNPEAGAQVMAALEPIRDELFENARAQGRRESPEAYGFDALVDLAMDSTSAPSGVSDSAETSSSRRSSMAIRGRGVRGGRRGAQVKLLVRIDYDAFLRGFPTDGETCELAGFGSVSVGAVRDLLATGDPFVAAILTRGRKLVGVAHLGRKPTAYQRSALEWLFPRCAVEGCHSGAHLEMDHVVDWRKTHFTMLDLLQFLCRHHHRLKSADGWGFVETTRVFVPPEDPRHPRHKRKRAG
jgi:Domain of unknown function (DUF222)